MPTVGSNVVVVNSRLTELGLITSSSFAPVSPVYDDSNYSYSKYSFPTAFKLLMVSSVCVCINLVLDDAFFEFQGNIIEPLCS